MWYAQDAIGAAHDQCIKLRTIMAGLQTVCERVHQS